MRLAELAAPCLEVWIILNRMPVVMTKEAVEPTLPHCRPVGCTCAMVQLQMTSISLTATGLT
jgi:hypothetical protein